MNGEINLDKALDMAKGIITDVVADLSVENRLMFEAMKPGDSRVFHPMSPGGVCIRATAERLVAAFLWRIEVFSAGHRVLETTVSTDPADSETAIVMYAPGEWEDCLIVS